MKRIFKIILISLVCLSLSSCENSFLSVEKLMRPPRLSGEDSILQEAFEASVENEKDIVMKTPVGGNYRSSYLLFDIDGDSTDEAIVLYSVPADGNFVVAKVFEYSGGKWFNTSQISGTHSEIYEINFADINGDGCHEIILSWIKNSDGNLISDSTMNTSYILEVYSYDGNNNALLFTDSYTELFFKDINSNKADEILMFKINFSNKDNLTTARLISFNEDYSVFCDKVTTISDMFQIESIVSDNVVSDGKNISRIFVDGTYSESEFYTEIIEIDESFNVSLPFKNNKSVLSKTLRTDRVFCMDVDRDGKVEIPSMEIFPYSERIYEGKSEPLNLVVWSEYTDDGFNIKLKSLLNTKVGHIAIIPEEFIGKLTAIYDEENLNLTFYSVTSDGKIANALFSFRIFTIPQWEENSFNYEKLHQNDTYVYSYLIFKAENYDYYKENILKNFYAL